MEKIEVEVDRLTFERAKTLAIVNQSSLSELITHVIERLAEIQEKKDPLMGLYADVPEIVDEILAEAMEKRGHSLSDE
ncbi:MULTISPECIES: hypothetical protein [Cyanophyceae]|uniref:Uncharacterized protein n=1 Tax=Nodularia spumigena CENA596 TaxID=1819295 RepID=A0A166KHX1_NODSP|nr:MULTISPECIES: hypothetical protein [Cyanophyceae]MDB9355961.1 hypothetical protein [Nodularia spumigena CS-587/03]KZL51156.1 hypothetical protein A2T98_03795 [Nodularia spumigena CENA596]MDB9306270.1 hypothetical protein [Nodularia spumigena CS-591/12]MDB9317801.1 hypothetical protein [Nodularia spumigena CS-590/01A]MDB9321830.1 hypothetical protein [Nodularia spumigena CS-591/07A]